VFITPHGCDVNVKADSEVEKFLGGVTLYSAHLKIEEARSAQLAQVAAIASGNDFLVFENVLFPERPIKMLSPFLWKPFVILCVLPR
jgi:hypothetical protein